MKYLQKFSDQNSRLLRWSIRLSELDFVVEHKPGSKIGHVDALSRHVGSVTHDNVLNKENVLREQEKDAFCIKQAPGTYRSKREFFVDDDNVLYRRKSNGNHQLVVPETLVQEVIKQNHEPMYVAHPGAKRTHDLIALHYWWPGMRKAVENYVKFCDPCQRRKGNREFVAPLGDVEEPTAPFEVTSMDITGPYLQTPRGNKYLLTFVDHFSKYVEAYPMPDQKAETCARIYASNIITRHGTGSQLITDQGAAFMSSFFQETCKVLGIRRTRTTSWHPASNGVVERWHRTLHTGISHYINSANTNWDTLVPFFLMAYRATPNTVTGFSPFYLLHGREMQLPGNDNLKARCPTENSSQDSRLEQLKASLRTAYKLVAKANKSSHQRNKKLYDRKAKARSFEVNDLVYLFTPATKPGLTRKFRKPWKGPYQITKKISDLNYELVDQRNKKSVVHVNRLKRAYNQDHWNSRPKQKTVKRSSKQSHDPLQSDDEDEIKIGPFPLVMPRITTNGREHTTPRYQVLDTPESATPVLDTPSSEQYDLSYQPPDTPRSRREFQPTRTEPPVTRYRTRILSQNSVNA